MIGPADLAEYRLRSTVSEEELRSKAGRVVAGSDFNVQLVGPTKLIDPAGSTLAVYLPGILADEMDREWKMLRAIRYVSDNRGAAAGSVRDKRGSQTRSRTRRIWSAPLGVADYPGDGRSLRAGADTPTVCRLTAWTARHPDVWQRMHPLLLLIDEAFRLHVPKRYIAQARVARATAPEWVVPGTVFTTVTVNNTYSTGVHQDSGDLRAGFSTLAVGRRGSFSGGHLVLAGYRVGVDMGHGDLLLFDAHAHHGNTAMYCPHQPEGAAQLKRPCAEGCERVSLVAYFRAGVARCAPAAEAHRYLTHRELTTGDQA